jgi:hypothetical protein
MQSRNPIGFARAVAGADAADGPLQVLTSQKSLEFVGQAFSHVEETYQFGLRTNWPNWLFTIVTAWHKLDW